MVEISPEISADNEVIAGKEAIVDDHSLEWHKDSFHNLRQSIPWNDLFDQSRQPNHGKDCVLVTNKYGPFFQMSEYVKTSP